MSNFTAAAPRLPVDPRDRGDVIDLVNRLNHIVYAHEDGTLSVRHYTVLVRVAPAERADDVRRADLTYDATGLPTIFMHSIVTDRCRKDPGHGWRIMEKRVDQTVANAGPKEGSPNTR